mgnify:CR=1 FL=1
MLAIVSDTDNVGRVWINALHNAVNLHFRP